jgi:YVTN family beta-propeller protein
MHYRVLGPIEIEDDGELLPLGGAKQRALLSVLLLHANEVVSRDVLIEDLWGEGGSRGSVHSLEVQVSRLRKVLGASDDQALVTRPTGYQLKVGADELDLLCFEQLLEDGRLALRSTEPEKAAKTLREALSLWRGRAFEDLAYESFAQVEIERLEAQRLEALEERIDADLALGRQASLAAELESLVRQHPLRERLRGQLMLALYLAGRQAEALSVYQDARRELVEELGIEPGHALRELEQAILRQDPELDVQSVPLQSSAVIAEERGGKDQNRRVLLIALVLLGLAAAAAGTAVALLSRNRAGLSGLAANSVGAIEPHTGKIVAEIPVGLRPTEVVAAGKDVWVANFDSGTLSRIDPQTRKVVGVTNAGGTPTGLAAGDGSIWVSNGFAGRVLRVDEQTGKVAATIPVVGHPGAIAVDGNAVWAANPITDTVARIDPNSLQVTTIRVGRGPNGVAVGAGAVWIANGLERTLTRIDSTSGAILRRRIALRFAPRGVSFGEGSVWVTGTAADAVARVDPRTDQSSASIAVGDGPTGIVVLMRRVWVADTFGRSLSEIDPARNKVVRTIGLGHSPEGLSASRGRLWVAAAGR